MKSKASVHIHKGFTLVEVLLAILLAAMLFGALFTFFGDTMQRFVQHEDTLTGVRDLQILLAYLRKDLSMLEGTHGLASSSRFTGTTFPKEYIHVCHSTLDTRLHCFRFQREDDDTEIPPIDPLSLNLPEVPRTELLLKRVAFFENACAWVIPDEDAPLENQKRYLYLNVRRGPNMEKVLYVFSGEKRSVTRITPQRQVEFGKGAVADFTVRPMLEFLTFPTDDTKCAKLLKCFFEIVVAMQAEEDGGRIAKRKMAFTTKVTPKLLNSALNSRWVGTQ